MKKWGTVPSTNYEVQSRDSCSAQIVLLRDLACLPTVGRPAAVGVHGTLYLVHGTWYIVQKKATYS